MLFSYLVRLLVVFCLGATALAAEPGVWLDVPFVRQQEEGCGSASIAMVMQYWARQRGQDPGPESQEPVIYRALFSKQAHGIYASDLEHYFQQQGFRTFAFEGGWDDLRQQLEKGRPLILALRPKAGAPLHYVVLAGIDWQHGFVLVNDPAQRKLLKQERASFETEWRSAESWMLLAVPRPELR